MISEYLSDKLRFLSFVSAVLVVLIHVPHPEFARYSFDWWCVDVILVNVVAKVAVPYFFFVSALFLFRNFENTKVWYVSVLKKRFHTLLIPFFMTNLLALLMYSLESVLTGLVHCVPLSTLVRDMMRYAYCAVGLDFTRYPLVGSLWFVRNLMVLVLLSPVIHYAVCKHRNIGVIVTVIMFGLWASPISTTVFFRIGFSLEGLFWFVAGAYCVKYLPKRHIPEHYEQLCAMCLIVMLIFGIIAYVWLPQKIVFIGKSISVVAGMLFFLISMIKSRYT